MAMKCYGNLSIIYHDFGDIDNSLYYAYKGYEIALRLGFMEQITFLSNFVSFYSQASDIANASKYYCMMSEILPSANSVVNGYFLFMNEQGLSAQRNSMTRRWPARNVCFSGRVFRFVVFFLFLHGETIGIFTNKTSDTYIS